MRRALLAILCSVLPGACRQCGRLMRHPIRTWRAATLRAAQSGDDEAQFYLGALYSAGVGVPRSDQEAFRWCRAANQGHSHAMLILAGLYAIGRGVKKNSVEAYKWAYIVNGASKVEEFRNGSRQLMGVLEDPNEPRRDQSGQESSAAPVAPPERRGGSSGRARTTSHALPQRPGCRLPHPGCPPCRTPAAADRQRPRRYPATAAQDQR